MEKRENSYSFFDRELRKNIDDSTVDYETVESKLFFRISEADRLEELEVLKLDEMPSSDTLEKVECKLFSQIAQYNEYDVPTNECISAEYDLSVSQWDRLETKIDERINNCTKIPEWEQSLMAPEVEPLPGKWETIEDLLFERINNVSGQELWVQTTKLDEIQIQDYLDIAEEALDRRIREKGNLESWEYIVKSEEIIPFSRWESIEEKLFDRLESGSENVKLLSLDKQPFWNILDSYIFTMKTVRNLSIAVLLVLIAAGGYLVKNSAGTILPTFVYQLQGSAADEVLSKNENAVNENFRAAEGGSVSIVNSHGLVELQNGSDLKVEKLTKKHAWYKVGFSKTALKSDIASGRVAFLVNPHKRNESFKVRTPDYQIIVKGTYFRVEPDLYGKMATRVLEGEVKVVSKYFGDTVVKAGQSLAFDLFTNEYKIQDGGQILQRKDLDIVPNVDELRNYKAITIRSSVPDADVRIDSRYFGTLPLTIRQPYGVHHIWVGKSGYYAVDTVITLEKDNVLSLDLKAIQITEPEKIKVFNNNSRTFPSDKNETVSPETIASALLGNTDDLKAISEIDSLYSLAQMKESKGNWRDAVSLYQEIFESPEVTSLRKEDALFSIAKIRADNETNKAEAREVFLTYLAMYPGGFFAGETWLRLAELEFKSSPENAVQYYLKYFEKFPRHPRISELQNRVGVIYLQQKKYNEAISLFRQALSNMVSQPKGERENVISNLYRALEAKGDNKSADSVLRLYNMNYSDEK